MPDKDLEKIARETLERQENIAKKANKIRNARGGKSIDQLIEEASEKGERYTPGEAVKEVNKRLSNKDELTLDEKIKGAQERSRSIADYVI